MASPNLRVRRNACYGAQFQQILTGGLSASRQDIRAAGEYFTHNTVQPTNDQEGGPNEQNLGRFGVYPEQPCVNPFPPQQVFQEFRDPLPGPSDWWEDEQRTSRLETRERTQSPEQGPTSSGVEPFPTLGQESGHPRRNQTQKYRDILDYLDSVPSLLVPPNSPKTPPPEESASDTAHWPSCSPHRPRGGSSVSSRPRPTLRRPSVNHSQFSNQYPGNQASVPRGPHRINPLTPDSSYLNKKYPPGPHSPPGASGSAYPTPKSPSFTRATRRSTKSSHEYKYKETLLPSPHDFETFNKRHRFDPLNFVPGSEDTENDVQECFPRPPPVLSSPFENPTTNRLRVTESFPSQPVDTPDSECSLEKHSVPYSELPVHSAPLQRKPRRSIRLAASLKRLFIPKSKAGSQDSTPVTSPQEPPQLQLDETPVVDQDKWVEEATQRLTAACEEPLLQPDETPLIDHDKCDQDKWAEEATQQLTAACEEQNDPDLTMEYSKHLDPSSAMMAITKQKSEAMRLAREQAAAVQEMCRRAKTEPPAYSFEELIGKGAYGRVYKGRQLPSQNLVAIKVLEIDTLDYKSIRDMKDESIKDFVHETKVMKQAKDAAAKNVNMLIEAVSIHSQLWLVCEYCPGGSVKTLMRATGDKLDEKFIIPIARELAEGLRAIHDAGIIHRDVKAANVLIHEEGRLQICDFGVAGVIQSKVDKRSTWIGTPHWMPPEMFPNRGGGEMHQYGSEVDVWAYGCTLFECATGNPPNATLRERMQIGRQLNRYPPKLEGDGYSDGLRSLVGFSLDSDPQIRPTMQTILQHPYIAESAESYPTSSLSELVRIYYQWAQRGGQRISLFNPGGAAAAELPGDEDSLDREDWNFSTTDGFERRFSLIDFDQLSASLADLENDITPTVPQPSGDTFDDTRDTVLTAEEQANFDERVKRGAAAMEGLFDDQKPDYRYETKNDFVPVEQNQRLSSDLPLRTTTDRSSVTSTFIDLSLDSFDANHYAAGSASNYPPFQLADADTIRANRSSSRLTRNSSNSSASTNSGEYQPPRGPRPPTMEWTFASAMAADTSDEADNHQDETGPDDEPPQRERRDTRAWTFPVMTTEEEPPGEGFADYPGEEIESARSIEPDDEMTVSRNNYPPLQHPTYGRPRDDGPSDSRPSTATSSRSAASDADNDPFRFDRPVTPTGNDRNSSFDKFPSIVDSSVYPEYDLGTDHPAPSGYPSHPWQDDIGATARNGAFAAGPALHAHTASSASAIEGPGPDIHTMPPLDAGMDKPAFDFPAPIPPSMESLTEGASDEVLASELDRLLGDFLHGLAITGEALVNTDVGIAAGVENGNGNGVGVGRGGGNRPEQIHED
ncbi:hypothetical protein FQN51_007399 [Onygenales sp. PD_10]|nr:hypothetical protein FQN51_007399 [Onygenales sp. PD_10]